MIVRVPDVPSEGLNLNFELDPENLSKRIDGDIIDIGDTLDEVMVPAPKHNFTGKIPVQIKLSAEGRTVNAQGEVMIEYETDCSRCANPAVEKIVMPINLIVKQRKSPNDEEDVGFSLL